MVPSDLRASLDSRSSWKATLLRRKRPVVRRSSFVCHTVRLTRSHDVSDFKTLHLLCLLKVTSTAGSRCQERFEVVRSSAVTRQRRTCCTHAGDDQQKRYLKHCYTAAYLHFSTVRQLTVRSEISTQSLNSMLAPSGKASAAQVPLRHMARCQSEATVAQEPCTCFQPKVERMTSCVHFI